MANEIRLKGRVFFTFDLETITGLHIGGSDTAIEIGGVDSTVIRDPISNQPYVPGSSLKGKMRSLLEKYKGLKQNQRIGQGYIHSCGADIDKKDTGKIKNEYLNCDVCQVFGVPGERGFATPTRIVVRDIMLDKDSAKKLTEKAITDLPYTEIKTEVAIDRITSAANPRQIERVPAGSIFNPGEIVFSVYEKGDCDPDKDIERLAVIIEGFQLIEDDYLGGLGTRGSGKVKFKMISIKTRNNTKYLETPAVVGDFDNLDKLVSQIKNIQSTIREQLLV